MYSNTELRSAVKAGVISNEAANAFRSYVSELHNSPAIDQEHVRLVTGFNDIFVTIAILFVLGALTAIGLSAAPNSFGLPLAGLLVSISAWGLAEFFTRKRRMALPSIVLALAFVGGTFLALCIFNRYDGDIVSGLAIAVCSAGAAVAHWRRFRVPITMAAGVAAMAFAFLLPVLLLLLPFFPNDRATRTIVGLLIIGLGIFAFAMRWDLSDPTRETRRSDVAFWLHLLAAPIIAHPLFKWLGVSLNSNMSTGTAVGVVLIYFLFALVSLAIDRRALLASALAYVLFAMAMLFRKAGVLQFEASFTALIVGSALLLLSAFWTDWRKTLLNLLPKALLRYLPPAG